jgi:hypothetical protein
VTSFIPWRSSFTSSSLVFDLPSMSVLYSPYDFDNSVKTSLVNGSVNAKSTPHFCAQTNKAVREKIHYSHLCSLQISSPTCSLDPTKRVNKSGAFLLHPC